MKIILLTLLSLFTLNLYADKKWIEIQSIDAEQTSKVTPKSEPINKMMQNVVIFKQLLDGKTKKEDAKKNEKNWFVLNLEDAN